MSGDLAWEAFQKRPFDLVVADLQLSEGEALSLLRRVRSAQSRDVRVPVVLMSSSPSLSAAAAAGRAGVTDCLPLDESGLAALLDYARAIAAAAPVPLPYVLLGSGPSISAARERILSLAALDTPVLIAGERGTGHWPVAAYLHRRGKHSDAPLHRVECFAQSDQRPSGDLGTWFLEEVQDLSAEAQEAWHRRIETTSVSRERGLGRVIASTTRDLRALAAQCALSPGLARELCQFEVWLPPLRERRDDLPKLIQAVLQHVSERIGRPGVGIAPRAVERLCACAWWENFNDLESALESLAAFALGGEITESQADLVVIDSDPVARAARERRRSEREELLRLVEECGGNLTRIAERLKVDRGTIRYRLRKHGLLQAGNRPEGGQRR